MRTYVRPCASTALRSPSTIRIARGWCSRASIGRSSCRMGWSSSRGRTRSGQHRGGRLNSTPGNLPRRGRVEVRLLLFDLMVPSGDTSPRRLFPGGSLALAGRPALPAPTPRQPQLRRVRCSDAGVRCLLTRAGLSARRVRLMPRAVAVPSASTEALPLPWPADVPAPRPCRLGGDRDLLAGRRVAFGALLGGLQPHR